MKRSELILTHSFTLPTDCYDDYEPEIRPLSVSGSVAGPAAAVLAALPRLRRILDHHELLDVDLAAPDMVVGKRSESDIERALVEAITGIAIQRLKARRIHIRVRRLKRHALLLIADDGGINSGRDAHSGKCLGLWPLVRLAIAMNVDLRFRRFRDVNVISMSLPINRHLSIRKIQPKETSYENRQPIAA